MGSTGTVNGVSGNISITIDGNTFQETPSNCTNKGCEISNDDDFNILFTPTDPKYCGSITKSYQFPIKNLYIKSSSSTAPKCKGGNDGTITVTVGVPGENATRTAKYGKFTYYLNGQPQPKDSSPSYTFTNVPAGTHIIKIEDIRGCPISKTVTVTDGADIQSLAQPTQITRVNCFGGTTGAVTLPVATGTGSVYEYKVDHSAWTTNRTFTGLAGGNHTAYARVKGCPKEVSVGFTIPEPTAPLGIDYTEATHVGCKGGADGKALVEVSGGVAPYTIKVGTKTQNSTNGKATLIGLSAGNHTITVTDNWGCVVTGSITIQQPAQALALSQLSSRREISCDNSEGANLKVKASGGWGEYYFRLNNGPWQAYGTSKAFEAFNLKTTGNHTITVAAAIRMEIVSPPVHVHKRFLSPETLLILYNFLL